MAFRPNEQRVVAGSMDMRPPGDRQQQPNSPMVQNFRPAVTGALRSRPGSQLVASGLGGSINNFARWGTRRYAAVGGSLREGPTLSTVVASGFDGQKLGMAPYRSLLWVMNKAKRVFIDGSTPHTWGIDAPTTPVTLTKGAQLKAAVAEFDSGEPWQVAWLQDNVALDPYAPVTLYSEGTVNITASSTTLTGVGTLWTAVDIIGRTITIETSGGPFTATISGVTDDNTLTLSGAPSVTETGLTYAITGSVTALQFDTSNKQSGTASLHVAAWGRGTWRAYRTPVTLDLNVGGDAEDADEFRMWFYASDPASITSITIALEDGSGYWMSCKVPPERLTSALYSWTQLVVLRGLDPVAAINQNAEYRALLAQLEEAVASENTIQIDALTARKEQLSREILDGILYFQSNSKNDFNWANVVDFHVDVEIAQPVDFHLDRAEFVGGLAASLSGTYTYYVTFANDYEHESNPGPGATIEGVDKQSIALSAIPVSADPSTTKKYIYREGGSINRPLRVAVISNATTTFNDVYGNDIIEANGVDIPQDNDPPPAASGLLPETYQGRLVAWDGNTLYWTPTALPYAWPEENFDDIGQDAENILWCTNHKRAIWIYKQRSIWTYSGDIDAVGTTPIQSSAAFSAVGPNAVVNAGAFDYFVGTRGVYRFNGESEQKISDAIDPIFDGEYVELDNALFIAPINQDAIATSCLGLRGDRLFFFYPEIGSSVPNVGLVCDLRTNTWSRYTGSYANITAIRDEGTGEDLLAGTATGAVLALEGGVQDGAGSIPLLWQSAAMDQDLPNNEKMYGDVVIDGRTAFGGGETPATLDVSLILDNGLSSIALGTFNSSTRTQQVFRINNGDGVVARNAAIRISGNASSTVLIYSVYIHWYPFERQAKQFDTDVFDLGTEKAKSIEAIELDISAAGSVDWKLFSDLPGNVMTQRATNTVTPGAGRRTYTILVSPAVEGKRFRFTLTGSSLFQLHGLKIRYRVLGDYYDTGDTWDSGNIDLRDVNLFRWLEVIADTTGAAAVELYTEIPGSNVASRFTGTLNSDATSTDRVPFQFSLPGWTRGQIVRVRITPTNGPMKLYGVRLFARATGKQASDWRYLDSPALPVWQPTQALQVASIPV